MAPHISGVNPGKEELLKCFCGFATLSKAIMINIFKIKIFSLQLSQVIGIRIILSVVAIEYSYMQLHSRL
jgi:hypothetical protein